MVKTVPNNNLSFNCYGSIILEEDEIYRFKFYFGMLFLEKNRKIAQSKKLPSDVYDFYTNYIFYPKIS